MVDLTLRAQCDEALRLLRAGDPAAAMTTCRRILETFSQHVETYSILAQAYLQAGQYEEAASIFRRVLSADPENALAYASLATIFEERGLYEEALWQLERALELSPGNREVRRELIRLRTERGMAAAPRLHMTGGALARLYMRGQLYPKAIGELRELIRTHPQRYDLRVALAEALWQDGQYQEAATVAQHVLADIPNCLKANLILGQVWLHTEKDEEARVLLQRAQMLDPENATAQALFGSRSPLPPRTPRLPFREEDAPPIAIPYLVDDEEGIVEDITIEGQLTAGVTEAEAQPQEARPDSEGIAPIEQAATVVAAGEPTPEEDDEPLFGDPDENERDLSLVDIQYRYLAKHPNDYGARLKLARQLRDMRDISGAVEQYHHLVQHDYEALPEVIRDLELLNVLVPGSRPLANLLAEAHARQARKPK
jgi:pentatricopeptide repeat protein